MATHSSILAWRIPWTMEPGGLQSMGLQRVRHDWATFTFFLPTCIWSFSFYMLISVVSFTNNGIPNNMLSQISLSGQLEHFIGSNFCHFSPSHLLFSLYWNFNSKSFDMSKLLPSLRKRVRRKFLLKDYRWIHVCPLCFQNYCKLITMCELERGKGMGDNGT